MSEDEDLSAGTLAALLSSYTYMYIYVYKQYIVRRRPRNTREVAVTGSSKLRSEFLPGELEEDCKLAELSLLL